MEIESFSSNNFNISKPMASSSSNTKLDVFLSFSGDDTREGFTNTLYDHLTNKGIITFIDKQLPRGQQIKSSLTKTIQQSKISVVVFSDSYASSSWCMDELVEIVECNRKFKQVVMPIFYKVNPFHVDKQIGSFGVEFDKLTGTYEKIAKWRNALSFLANQSGWDFSHFRTEMELIKEVAAVILNKIDFKSLVESTGLIGIDSRVEDIGKMLSIDPMGVQLLGVWGMGGIGKTTTVEVVYNKISSQFDACCYVANVSQRRGDQLDSLRTEIFSKLLRENNLEEGTPNQPSAYVIRRLRTKKVLIALDNVSNGEQVDSLVGSKSDNWFGSGSRIIIISKDRNVFDRKGITFYEVKELNIDDSLRLFCSKAFEQNEPPKEYIEWSQSVVNYTKRVPLALKVLGSHLYKRDEKVWRDTLKDLEDSVNLEIERVLKVSYDELEWKEKMIFLDIACFFRGDDADKVKDVLDGSNLSASIGITRLTEKCLVNVNPQNKIEMHDLLQKMGWQIVRQEPPCERSRFWKPADVLRLLTSDTGAKVAQGIFMDLSESRKVDLDPSVFSRMEDLRLLKFYQGPFAFDYSHESRMSFSRGIRSFPDNLRYIYWDGYPCKSLPSEFSGENVVELNMPNSQLKRLWYGVKHPLKLKVLDLRGCINFKTLPDLSFSIKLEKIILDDCLSLCEIPISIQFLWNLSHLSLRVCVKLQHLPSLVDLKSLKTLDLYQCANLNKFPEVSTEIEVLNLFETTITEWPQSMSSLNNLKEFTSSEFLRSLPHTVYLNSLKSFTLGGCLALDELPEIIGSIEKLDLSSTGIRTLPSSIMCLDSLVELNLRRCGDLEILPSDIGQLKCLETLNLQWCSKLFNQPLSLSGLNSIKKLYLAGCELSEFPKWLSNLSCLVELDLSFSYFKRISKNIILVSRLEVLDLCSCPNLQSLPELPCQVNCLAANDCVSLKTISTSFIAQGEPGKLVVPNFETHRYIYSFADCTELEEDARSQIIANAEKRIQNMANSRNKDPASLIVSVPGSEIPKCFHHCNGSSIQTELPRKWCSSDFMGFVLYVIAYTGERTLSLNERAVIICSCKYMEEDGSAVEIPMKITESNTFRGETLIIFYTRFSSNQEPMVYNKNHRSITRVDFDFQSAKSNVLRCGFDLVYAKTENENNCDAIGANRSDGVGRKHERETTLEEPKQRAERVCTKKSKDVKIRSKGLVLAILFLRRLTGLKQ